MNMATSEKWTDWEIGYVIGFLKHGAIIQSVREGVNPYRMSLILDKTGWYEGTGLIRFCELWQEDERLANAFVKENMYEGHLGDFSEHEMFFDGEKETPNTEENFRERNKEE